MQWGQIKTLFILCFLLLDVYLLFLYLEKEKNEDLSYIERPELTIEEQLKSDNIGILEKLPEPPPDEALITVRQKKFSDDEIETLSNFENQTSKVVNNVILSKFEEPITLSEDASSDIINQLVKSHVIFPGEYEFKYWDETYNVLVFLQQKNGRPVYFNQNGLLLVLLNEKDEMVAYTQSMLGEPETNNDKKSLINPLIAIGSLYDNYQLIPGSSVTDMEMGYHTMLPLENGEQVMVPTWKVTVNEETDHYVNAVERRVFPTDDQEFLNETLSKLLERARLIEDDEELRADMVNMILSKLEAINRSEEE